MEFSNREEIYDLNDHVGKMDVEKHYDVGDTMEALMFFNLYRSRMSLAEEMIHTYVLYGKVLESVVDEKSKFMLLKVWRKQSEYLAEYLDSSIDEVNNKGCVIYDRTVNSVEDLMVNLFEKASEYIKKN